MIVQKEAGRSEYFLLLMLQKPPQQQALPIHAHVCTHPLPNNSRSIISTLLFSYYN